MPPEYRAALAQAVNAMWHRTTEDYVRLGLPRREAEAEADRRCQIHRDALIWVQLHV